MNSLYLHLGNDVVVSEASVVGIFDIENTSISKYTKEYLAAAQKENKVIYVTDDLPKSFVVCKDGDGFTVYVCQVSPATMLKRAEANDRETEKLKKLICLAEQEG